MTHHDVMTVHFGDDARLTMTVAGETSSIDLRPYAAGLLRRPAPTTGAADGVDFAVLEAEGAVRFFRDGRRVGRQEGLERLAGAIVAVITDLVRDDDRAE